MVSCVSCFVIGGIVVKEGGEDAAYVKVVEDAGDADIRVFEVIGVARAVTVAAAGVSSSAGEY